MNFEKLAALMAVVVLCLFVALVLRSCEARADEAVTIGKSSEARAVVTSGFMATLDMDGPPGQYKGVAAMPGTSCTIIIPAPKEIMPDPGIILRASKEGPWPSAIEIDWKYLCQHREWAELKMAEACRP